MVIRAILRRPPARPEMQGLQSPFPATAPRRLQDCGQERRPLPQDAGSQRSHRWAQCDDEPLRTASETARRLARAITSKVFSTVLSAIDADGALHTACASHLTK